MQDEVDAGATAGAVPPDAGGISRRTMIRRTAVAGGALLWATPVVQTLGNDSAYAWFRGSSTPGTCLCSEAIVAVRPIACHAEPGTKLRIAKSGKYVTLQALGGGSCGTRPDCESVSEVFVWTVVSAHGCTLYSQKDDTAVIHVTAYPATITLQIAATLSCQAGKNGVIRSCMATKVQKVCFTQVTGSESQRCGRFEPHRNKLHGTVRCPPKHQKPKA
jgi:hypothetical protein